MFKGLRSIINIFLLAIITVGIATFIIKKNYSDAIISPNSDSSEKVELEISQGESIDSIIQELVDKNLIQEKWANYFKLYVRVNDLAPKIQSGKYQIPKNLNIKEIVETIQHAKDQDVWITIPEGIRKDEIAKKLSTEFSKVNNANFSETDFLKLTEDQTYILTLGLPTEVKDLEGYLFPDKYAFSKDATTQSVMDIIIENFKTKVGVQDTYNEIIIASMVEREGYTSEDRPMIADIIERRLTQGWLLQIDASLLYPIKDWKHEITQQDKLSDSPYNLYKKAGLPPTPICNPGLQSINAVRSPKSNDYYYYIHDKDGNVHYAKTLAEHNSNVNTYLR
jgi:UPF0755 protein